MSVSNQMSTAQSVFSAHAVFIHTMRATSNSVSFQQMWSGAKILSNAGAIGVSNDDLATCI